ncbi:MAG: type IV pilus twitching motility protein PilT [Phycisphaerae bacterium]|nr:type IV pilus twitching motility protein PilT [Phycisphaerae bacterium]MCZ2400294.1 type IV pilus twitching motility protein PilT [Phycisphaerae bacterium]NUQ50910.1 type IV pilus twitching motility protein PilT [Phycisphaerae bacterium]
MATVHIDRLLETCIRVNASDIHLHVGRPPVLRMDGRLRSLETKVLEPDDTVALMKSVTPERNQQEFQEEGGTDFGFAFGDKGRFRVSVFRQKGHVSMVLRLIPSKILTFEEIGLPAIIRALCRRPRGLFLVTGPTGSGKTTTLATMLDYVNRYVGDRHIISVEDPIEYYHTHQKCVFTQREVGVDVPSFAEALRRSLRMDPDVILVGEMRDLETMEAAIRAAETGHLVFATLHTTGAQGTINRIIDAFPVAQQEQIRVQLSTTLIAVLSQTLLPKIGSGRVAGYEFLLVTPAIANLIRENKTYRIDSSIQTGKKYGMQLLDDHLWKLYDENVCAGEECIERARFPAEFQAKMDAKARGQAAGGLIAKHDPLAKEAAEG